MKTKLFLLTLLTLLLITSCQKGAQGEGSANPVSVIENISNDVSTSGADWTQENWDEAADQLDKAIANLPSPLADDEQVIVSSAIARMKVYAERHKNLAAHFLVAVSKFKPTEADNAEEKTSSEATEGKGGPSSEVDMPQGEAASAPIEYDGSPEGPASIYDNAPAGLLTGHVIQEGGWTNVRSGPGTSYGIVTKIQDGDPIYYTDYNASWCIIYNSAGQMLGYMHSSKVIPGGAPAPARASRGDVAYGTQYDWLSTRYATTGDLAGYDTGQLRVLRNSIYARHGRIFRDANLRSYFNSQPWYNGYRQEIPASELNQYEQYNIQFIQSRE